MSKHHRHQKESAAGERRPAPGWPPFRQVLFATGGYFLIAAALTFPLVFRMGSSVYGPYDHATTDLFSSIYLYFWWIKQAIVTMHISPFVNPLLAAPFAAKMTFPNFTGLPHLPVSLMFGAVFSRNVAILFNLIVAGTGMFLLVRHLTGRALAAFVAGVIFAFCPNMMVRSYTTFDSTQVQWIPLYTLYVIRFLDRPGWRNAILAGVFLVCFILFSFPYYLVYLPVHTTVLLAVYGAHRWRTGGKPFGAFIRDLAGSAARRHWLQAAGVIGVAFVIFVGYYFTIVGGESTMSLRAKTTEQLEALALVPTDYLMPHPMSTFFAGDVKQIYWDADRPGKDPNSFVAYVGYTALLLAALGMVAGRRRSAAWFFLAGGIVAFWSTLGPSLFGLPTPSGLIHSLYAPFARRILIYKVFVQFSVAGLAGYGLAAILGKIRSSAAAGVVTAVAFVLLLAEYLIVPPALSVDLSDPPELYRRIRDLPAGSVVIEVPQLRNNGLAYQGYLYYQTIHGKPLFNDPYQADTIIPETLRRFYRQMEVPLEAEASCNLAALRALGVTHLTYHWYIGTRTVQFGSFSAPHLASGTVPELRPLYRNDDDPLSGHFAGPYDYVFADLYEITAAPCPVALTFDYHSPFEQIPGVLDTDFLAVTGEQYVVGWVSALLDDTSTWYFPFPGEQGPDRVMRTDGMVTVTSTAVAPVDFTITFEAESPDSGRVVEARWNGREVIGRFTLGPEPHTFEVEPIRLDAGTSGAITFHTDAAPFRYEIAGGALPATAVMRAFRVHVKTD